MLSLVASSDLDFRVHARYPLEHEDRAHRELESRTTKDKLVLVTGASRDTSCVLYYAPSQIQEDS